MRVSEPASPPRAAGESRPPPGPQRPKDDGAGDAPEAAEVRAPHAARGHQQARILVVDDEPLARQMFADLLEAHGFEVVTVGRGEEVFNFLGEVDLVLLDAMLPGRDGWSICSEIKSRSDSPIPVIMVTARTAPDDVVRTFSAGADDYIAKPFHVTELTARIESRLRVYRAERAIQNANRQLKELAEQNYELYERARRDAEERASLLRELDHRVRNNLSVIMGLLGMERNRKPTRATAEALASLEGRIRSFLLVYEALRRQNYRGVPVREIAERLTQRLRNSMDLQRRIATRIEGESILLDEPQGFALALALSELITNVYRHAFPDERRGTLRIIMAETHGTISLEVCDDGVGSAVLHGPHVLGSGRSIVEALVESELGGCVDYDSGGGGTCVRLTFPRARTDDQYVAR